MEAVRKPLPDKILGTFRDTSRWPRTVLSLIYIESLRPTDAQLAAIDSERKRICTAPREGSLCVLLNFEIERYRQQCQGDQHFDDLRKRLYDLNSEKNPFYYNTAKTFCSFSRFAILLGEMRLTGWQDCHGKLRTRCIHGKPRPALEMIAYLGQLIAAQNYIDHPFEPFVFIGDSGPNGETNFVTAPLFEVRRGVVAPGGAAVSVVHEGENFYIPRPDFGSHQEARSLETLDLVLETVRAATYRTDLPKLQTFGVVSTK
jgi:hypothetical protein